MFLESVIVMYKIFLLLTTSYYVDAFLIFITNVIYLRQNIQKKILGVCIKIISQLVLLFPLFWFPYTNSKHIFCKNVSEPNKTKFKFAFVHEFFRFVMGTDQPRCPVFQSKQQRNAVKRWIFKSLCCS